MDVFTPSGKRRVAGAYIQEKLTWNWLEVVGALRYDSYKLDSDVGETSGDRLSPRITVGVSPFEQIGLAGLQIYGTYAEGYRSPSLSETLISGLHPNGVVFPFLPNPNLRPETAKTWEAGLNYKADGIIAGDDSLRLKAAYYTNDIDDYIAAPRCRPSIRPRAARSVRAFRYATSTRTSPMPRSTVSNWRASTMPRGASRA